MNKLFILVGKSGSGKSTIENEIHKLGLANKVISTTTRSPRSYEIDGKDYYFISELVFKTYLEQGQYAEWSQYPMVSGLAYYGINRNDIKLGENNYICVVNPHGMRQLVDNLGEDNVVTIYINRDDRDRIVSSLNRDNVRDFKELLDETYRRYNADLIDFADVKTDYIIYNCNIKDSVEEVRKIIKLESEDN